MLVLLYFFTKIFWCIGDEIKLQRVGLVYVRQNEKESDILKFTDNISNIWPR